MPNLSHLLILGLSFHVCQQVVVNYKTTQIKIASCWLTFDDSAIVGNKDSCQQLLDKACVCATSTLKTDKLKEQFLTPYIEKNPALRSLKGFKMQIKLRDNNPIKQRPFPIPYCYEKEVKNEINRLLANKIIRPSQSKYAAPAFLVKMRKFVLL